MDAGVYGAVLALLWLAVYSRLAGEYWWSRFNVAAAPFFGNHVFSAGLGLVTLTGGSLLLIGFSGLGAVLGRLTPAPPRWYRSLGVSMIGTLVVFLLAQRWFWPALHPFARTYFTPAATLPAHLLFGLAMVRLGRRYLALMVAFGGLEWPPAAPAPESPEEEGPIEIVARPPDPLE